MPFDNPFSRSLAITYLPASKLCACPRASRQSREMQRKFDFSRGIFLFFSKSGPVHTRTTPAPGRGGCVSRLFRRFATQRIARTSSCFDSRSTSNTNIIALGDERAVGGDIIRRYALLLLDYFNYLYSYPHLFPRKGRETERQRERARKNLFFFFLFLFQTGSGVYPHARPRKGGGWLRVAWRVFNGTLIPQMGPITFGVMA
jgi:hypothetical protein